MFRFDSIHCNEDPHPLPHTCCQRTVQLHRNHSPIAISNNSISVHTFHFKYLKTFLTNRFECLFCISKHVSQRDMESTYREWRTSRRAGLGFVRILTKRTTPNVERSQRFSGSNCGCLPWSRDRVQCPSVTSSAFSSKSRIQPRNYTTPKCCQHCTSV
jgi:hypothetical protein